MSDERSSLPEEAALPAEGVSLPSAGDSGEGETLPPVQPPSAGFIIQLFLVPGLIVLAVVAVWALFGKMASSEQNWQRLVGEMQQKNPHRRWRGAMSLIQLLRADAERGAEGQQLASNAEVARALAGMLQEELQSHTTKADDLKKQEFLARGLRLLDVPEIVLPVLQQTMTSHPDDPVYQDVRKNAVASVAVILGRARERDEKAGEKPPGKELRKLIEFPSLLDDLESVSQDRDPLMRQIAAFTLGLLPTPAAQQRLEVMLEDPDEKTRVNAAVALARQESKKGLPVFETVLREAQQQRQIAVLPAEKRTYRYFWIGTAAFVLLVTATWAFGTTHKGARVIASLLALGAVTYVSWGIYDLVQYPEGKVPSEISASEPGLSSADFAERRQELQNQRFERIVTLQNVFKAVVSLQPHWTPAERRQLIALIEPLAEGHPEKTIQLNARQTLRQLKTSPLPRPSSQQKEKTGDE